MSLDPRSSSHPRPAQAIPISLHARALGAVEFVCPHCFRFQRVLTVNWRRPRWRCTNRVCNRQVAFGIHAGMELIQQPPWGAVLIPSPSSDPVANSLGSLPEGSDQAIGQVVGPLEWWCPTCFKRNLAKPVPGLGQVTCRDCRTPIFISLVIRQTVPGAHAKTPTDWIPPLEA
jgi:hypothetical protein